MTEKAQQSILTTRRATSLSRDRHCQHLDYIDQFGEYIDQFKRYIDQFKRYIDQFGEYIDHSARID
ncbi:MAG: hypothetical protein ABF586_07080 [Sporolactobacillus sp.]